MPRTPICLSLCLGLLSVAGLALPATAATLGPFDQALSYYTKDGVLDGQEYAGLRELVSQSLPSPDRALAKHFLSFAAKHPRFIRMSYSYYREESPVRLNFAFAPTYSEDSFIEGATSRDLLAQISQNDVLGETASDSERCGAAALLAAHYLLYGSFEGAFSKLSIQAPALTYRSVHQAQDALYRQVNRDGQPGLVSMFRYTQYSDGRVERPVPDGEINEAARLLRLRVHPQIGTHKSRFNERKQSVETFWRQYPETAYLVGVHLNEKNGNVRAPSKNYPQNHFVLVFKQNNKVWLLNSGVLDNGNRSALISMSSAEVETLLYRTTGSVDALTRS